MNDERKPKHSSVPISVLDEILEDQKELIQGIATSNARLESLTTEHVPRIEKVATEARNSAIKLDAKYGRIVHDTKAAMSEVCRENQGECTPVKGLMKLRSKLVAAVLTTIALTAAGAFTVWRSLGEYDQRIIVNTSDVEDAKDRVKVLENGRQEDMRLILTSLGEIPEQVQEGVKAASPEEHPLEIMEDAAHDAPFNKTEMKQIEFMIKRAHRRQKNGVTNKSQ